MKFSEMKDQELIELAENLYGAIYVSECFGRKDLEGYDCALNELEKRGYTYFQTIHFVKLGDDEEEGGDKE